MISRINDFDKLYFEPTGSTLFFIYKDRPGIIGSIGSALATAGINIDDMRNPHDAAGENSLALLRVDSPVDQTLIDQIATEVGAFHAYCVNF